MNATPAPLPRKRVPCRRCGRGVLVAAYAGSYPTFIRCAACYRVPLALNATPSATPRLSDTERQAA